MNRNTGAAIFLAVALTACVHGKQVISNYRPGSVVTATIGNPLIAVQGRATNGMNGVTYTFDRQLIYGGKTGETIKMTYREFSNSMARPAFTQDLQYDLSQSKKIAFQEMRLEVLNATNEQISANVLPPAKESSNGLVLEPQAEK